MRTRESGFAARSVVKVTVALAFVAMAACGADRGSGGSGDGGTNTNDGGPGTGGMGGAGGGGLVTIPGLKSIRVEPPMISVTLTGGMAATAKFKAIGVFDKHPERDITSEVTWRSDNLGRASVDATGTATTGINVGGAVTITAMSGFAKGDARLNIKYSGVILDETVATPLPADVGDKFAMAPVNAATAPKLVYPATGALLPPNLFGVEVHFRPAASHKLFELQFQSEYLDLKVYTRCASPAGVQGCIYAAAKNVWQVLTSANRGGGVVKLMVRGMDEAGTGKGESDSIDLMFSRDDLLGAVYYWTTTDDGAIMRWDFGSTTQVEAEVVVKKGPMTGNACPGCHALNRDGDKMVLSVGGQNDGRMLLLDMPTKMPKVPFPLAQRSQFESWNPNGSAFVGTYNDKPLKDNPGYGQLIFFDGATGAVKSMFKPASYLPNHSDWSPDGAKIAFTTIGEHNTDQKSFRGGLAYVRAEGDSWSEPVELLPQVMGKNRFYPAISPTSDFLAFNESTCPEGKSKDNACDFDMDPSSKLFGMFFDGNRAPVEFANANHPGIEDGTKVNIVNSYPKWSPFVFQLSEERRLLWLTFTSQRAYGLRGSRILLWMVGIDPGAMTAGKDPSFAAFALPFQDLDSNNHIAQWTSRIPVVQ